MARCHMKSICPHWWDQTYAPFPSAVTLHKVLCAAHYEIAEIPASYFILVTNRRTHTRNKISTSTEARTDKDVRGDQTAGQGGDLQRQRWRKYKAEGRTRIMKERKVTEKEEGRHCAPCEDAIRCSPLCQYICRLPSDILEEKKEERVSTRYICRSLLCYMVSGRAREREREKHCSEGGLVGFMLSFIGWLD